MSINIRVNGFILNNITQLVRFPYVKYLLLSFQASSAWRPSDTNVNFTPNSFKFCLMRAAFTLLSSCRSEPYWNGNFTCYQNIHSCHINRSIRELAFHIRCRFPFDSCQLYVPLKTGPMWNIAEMWINNVWIVLPFACYYAIHLCN